jgi:hypothetical protein
MASIYDKSSLVLIPSGTKTGKVYSQKPVSGDGDFTFTRSSAATRVNADGFIEKETQNLLKQSNNFDTSPWGSGDGLTGGQTGYDGSSDAWLFNYVTNPAIVSCSNTNGGVQTYSVYAKGNTNNGLRLYAFGSSNCFGYFDLNAGSVEVTQNLIDATIEDKGDGWYRCAITFNQTNTQLYMYLSNNQNSNAGSGSIYIQDAQLEQGLVARDYIETTTTAVEGGITDNVPRLDYTDSSCPALLLEPQRTNLVPISEGVPEDIQQSTLTKNYGISPEGVQNSLKVQKQGVNANDRILPIDNYNAVLVSGTSYSVSAFVKNIDVDGITTIACRLGSGGTLFRLGYEWNGSSLTKSALYGAGTRTNEILKDYGNGWWRIGFSFEADNTEGNIEIDIDRANGSDTTSIETWGWQLESATGDASYATSYIPTYGSSVTRNEDFCEKASVSDLIGQTEGTMFVEAKVTFNTRNGRILLLNSIFNQFIELVALATRKVQAFVWNGSIQANIQSTTLYSSGDTLKIAFAYKENDFVLYINGVQQGVDTSGALPSTMSKIIFNNYTAVGYSEANQYKQALLFKTRLSNEELAALTTI